MAVFNYSIYNMVKFEKRDVNEEKSSNLISCAYILVSTGLHLQIIDYSCSINGTLMVRFGFCEPLCNETLILCVLAVRFAKPVMRMKKSRLLLQVWDVWARLHKSKSMFEEILSDHDKLYESSQRTPG